MHRRGLLLIVIFLCLFTQAAFAQNPNDLATSLDQHAAAVGLPVGDGIISPAENALATAVTNEVKSFSNTLSDFAAASPQNSSWINGVEKATQSYNQRLASENNVQSAGEATNQYRNELASLKADVPADQRAQSILDSVSPNHPADPLTSSASDAYGTQVMNAVYADSAQQGQILQKALNDYTGSQAVQGQPIAKALYEYASENAAKGGLETLPPGDQFLVNMVIAQIDDYLKSDAQNSNVILDKGQQTLVNMTIDAINEYLEKYDGKHKETVKRHVKRLIEIMVPSQLIPINGRWRILPYTVSTSGQCINTWGDNDGPGTGGPNDNPGEPLCGYANSGSLPFITWQGGIHPYMPGTSSMYGQAPQYAYYSVTNKQGQTTRSVKVSTFTEYEVISPTQIRVHTFMQEEGGCTMNANYIIELVTADESVCPTIGKLPIPKPNEVVEPPEETSGPFTVALPLINDETQCNESNALPEFDRITLSGKSDGSINVDYGAGTQTLFLNGKDYYDYDSGRGGKLRQHISLSLNADHVSGMVFWSNRDQSGNVCSASLDFALPGSEEATNQEGDTPNTDTSADGGGSDTTAFTLTSGGYTVTWQNVPGTQCPDTLKAGVPNFEAATISANGSDFTLEAAGKQYSLTNQSGQFMYTAPIEGDGMDYMGIFSKEENGHFTGIFSHSANDGSACVSTLDFAPA